MEATKRPWTAHILDCPKDRIGEYVQQCVENSGGDEFHFISAPHEDGGDADIAHVGNGPRGKDNAAFIVRAVNTFDQAREALKLALDYYRSKGTQKFNPYEVEQRLEKALAAMSEPLLQWHKEGDEWNLRARGKRTIATVFELKKSRTHAPPPHALTREQVETTISRFLSWHDCEPECDHDLQQVLETDVAQRETMEQQAGEIERLDKDLGAERVRGNFYKSEIDRSDALLNQFGIPNIAHECGDMLKPVDERIELVFVRMDTINQQLAAMTTERDEITSRWKHEFELRCKEEDKNDQLQARLTASEAKATELKRSHDAMQRLVENQGKELAERDSKRCWTKARPTVAGVYFWRSRIGQPINVCAIGEMEPSELHVRFIDGESYKLSTFHGEWQGPLTPGEE